jgi:hypothetical protein
LLTWSKRQLHAALTLIEIYAKMPQLSKRIHLHEILVLFLQLLPEII